MTEQTQAPQTEEQSKPETFVILGNEINAIMNALGEVPAKLSFGPLSIMNEVVKRKVELEPAPEALEGDDSAE